MYTDRVATRSRRGTDKTREKVGTSRHVPKSVPMDGWTTVYYAMQRLTRHYFGIVRWAYCCLCVG